MSHLTISPSQVALQAARRQPLGILSATQDGVCAFCGVAHTQGERVVPFSPEDSFTDYGSLRGSGSKFLCGWCAGTWNVDFTQTALKAVMCSEGVFPSASNADIAYWVMNPPKGKWIWVMGDQKRQHIVWRATVNTSTDIFQVRLGESNMTIRRAKVGQAAAACVRLAAVASEGRKGAPFKSPFVSLSRDLDSTSHGIIRPDLHRKALDSSIVKADIALVQSCTPGELWALTAVLFPKKEALNAPVILPPNLRPIFNKEAS
jgi:CRISPR type IV-associated protein Csf1